MAQPGHNADRQEKIEAFKRTYITMKLDLNTEEAEKFWPVYNEYQDALQQLRKEHAPPMEGAKMPEDMTEEELEALLQDFFDVEQQRLDLRFEYTEKFREVLPLVKVVKLGMVEGEFKRELMEKFSEKKEGK
jgi:hypothetical protein